MLPCFHLVRHAAVLVQWSSLLAAVCQAAQPLLAGFAPGETDQYVAVNGVQRRYKLFVPTGYENHEPGLALWIMCPGTGDTPENLIRQTGPQGMLPFAQQHKFAFAALEGDSLSMNVEAHSQSLPWRPDDVLYTMAVLRDVRKKVYVDMDRIRCVGFSRGARFCSRLASELSSFISAVAPVSGVRFPLPNNATRPMPIIAFHGKDDKVNPFWGNGDVYWTESVPDVIHKWAHFNDCTKFEQEDINARVTLFKHTDCKDDADVFLVQVEGAGHTWPGSNVDTGLGVISHDINANVDIFNFFKVHPKRNKCRTAQPGDKCHHHVTWAKAHGIYQQAAWYTGLNSSSTFEDFQSFLHDEIMEDCPRPCAPTTTTTTTSTSTSTHTSTTSTTVTRTTTTTSTVTTTTTTTTSTQFILIQWVHTLTHLQVKTDNQGKPAHGTLKRMTSFGFASATGAFVVTALVAIAWKARTMRIRHKPHRRQDNTPWLPASIEIPLYASLQLGESRNGPLRELCVLDNKGSAIT